MSDFIFDFLPSFYKDQFIDDSGSNVLTPIFNGYVDAMGDALYLSQQISQLSYLEKAPWYIEETLVTIDTRNINWYKTGYIIDDKIILFGDIYYDAAFTSKCNVGYTIKYDPFKKVKYIVFGNEIHQDTLFVKYCRKDYNTLQKIFGSLYNHLAVIPAAILNATADNDIIVNYNDIESEYLKYKNQLIAIGYGLNNPPTLETLSTMVGLYCSFPYAPFDGVIDRISGNVIDIKNNDGTIKSVTCSHRDPELFVGQRVKKYRSLEKAPFRIFDVFNKPYRFASYLLGNLGIYTQLLLQLNKSDNEQDASLYFDTNLEYDAGNLFWDMGHHLPGDPIAPTDINILDIPSFEYSDTEFIINNYFVDELVFVDPGFVDGNTQVLYEMYRNLLIFEYSDDDIAVSYEVINFEPYLTDNLKKLIQRVLPTHLKVFYIEPLYFVDVEFVDDGFCD